MNDETPPNRCRIVLLAGPGTNPSRVQAALDGGDVASVILFQEGVDEVSFQQMAEKIVPVAQRAGAAAIVAGDTRIAGRVQADGIHVEAGKAQLADAVARFQSRMSVGAGGARTRDEALELGEERPDYLFFGRYGYDTKPEAHPRNLTLGAWWAEMIEIPCIIMAGSDVSSVVAVAATGAEFVALSSAVFSEGTEATAAVARANALLDEHAPVFGD